MGGIFISHAKAVALNEVSKLHLDQYLVSPKAPT
jgi:hypothetical protein